MCCPAQVVVLWVGTNNYQHTAEQVAGGILAIAELLHSRLPKAKLIVLVSHFVNVFLVHQCWIVVLAASYLTDLLLPLLFFLCSSVTVCSSCAMSLTRTCSLSVSLIVFLTVF